jgi:hypothetical protein
MYRLYQVPAAINKRLPPGFEKLAATERVQMSGFGPNVPKWGGQSMSALPGQFRRQLNLDAQIPDGALDFGVAQEDLHRS